MNEVKELLGFGKSKVKVLKVESVTINKKVIKKITLVGTVKQVKCPTCSKYTSSVHDTLKPANLKFNKVAEQDCIISLIKRRFVCHKCKKRIIEDIGINSRKRTVANRLEIKIRKDLLKPNFNIKQIAEDNNVSHNCVRNILKEAMTDYPEYLRTLPEVISFDEFKADTSYGKYAFIVNNPICKKH